MGLTMEHVWLLEGQAGWCRTGDLLFLPVPRAQRSQFGAKDKAQKMEITRRSNGCLHLPIRKWVKTQY